MIDAAEIIDELDPQNVVVERIAATTIDPLTGRGTKGSVVLGTLLCSVQPKAASRVDAPAGTSTAGQVDIYTAANVMLPAGEGEDPVDGGPLRAAGGQGGSQNPPDYIRWAPMTGQPLRRWRVNGGHGWPAGGFIHYTATDEGAVPS